MMGELLAWLGAHPWTQALRQLVRRSLWGRILSDALASFGAHHSFFMAAAISFYSMLSLAPLVYLAFWGLQRFVGSSAGARAQLHTLLGEYLMPSAADQLVGTVTGVQGVSGLGGLAVWAALIALAWSGVSFYDALQGIFTVAWGGRHRTYFRRKLHALWAFIGAGLFVGLTMVLTGLMTVFSTGIEGRFGVVVAPTVWFIGWLSPYLLAVVVFFLLYKFLPNVSVRWNVALLTALPVGILWELSKRVFANATVTSFQSNFYGPVAWFVLLMVWIYWSSVVVLMGAEIGGAYQRSLDDFQGEAG